MAFFNINFFIVASLIVSGGIASARGLYTPEKPACKNMLGTELVFPKQNKFLVFDYKPDTDTYILLNPEAPGEGLMNVTLKGMAEGAFQIKNKWNTVIANPEDIVGETYIGEKDVPTLTEKELAARKDCSRKAP